MTNSKIFILTFIAMVAFAANSLLCRLALAEQAIDPSSFTSLRIISGALMLLLIILLRSKKINLQGDWLSSTALFFYCAGFSFAYIGLTTGTGALLLFACVQVTMLLHARFTGLKLKKMQVIGLCCALLGLIYLVLPNLATPGIIDALLMIIAGIAWGIYSIRGKSATKAIESSAGNFLRASGITLIMSLAIIYFPGIQQASSAIILTNNGIIYAILSGALTSGLGYAIWYYVLPYLKAITASSVQLTVPVLAALAGAIFLSEPITWRFLIAALLILGGIALMNLSVSKIAK